MADGQQHEGSVPLTGPAVLVAINCEGCGGTGFLVVTEGGMRRPWQERDALITDVPNRTVPHEDCDGSGRVVQEIMLPDFVEMAGAVTFRYSAPSPSEVRRGA